MATWVIQHFPPHRIYVEPYGGAASVLLRKPRSYAEIYNDLDDGVVNLFRVLRSDRAAELLRALELTPFARSCFEESYLPTDDPIEAARRLVVRSFQGFGSDGHNPRQRTGFRASSNRSGTTPAHDWANLPAALRAIVQRMQGVVIESRHAMDICAQHDSPETLHYLDPPYMPDTRSMKSRRGGAKYHAYTHEMTEADHFAMLQAIQGLRGAVVLSGYPHALYDDALRGWRRVTRAAHADGARDRIEALWINPVADAGLAQRLLIGEAYA
ncbi:DNA adenine methylase [Roseococcus sp. SDR]|nr:DNA adenine methylase [Roseococcus sp. SDR]MBV1845567.1 DNA adenine methylase [Roseococcus sp. SDR]